MSFIDKKTRHGYDSDLLRSYLQKAVRQGKADEAVAATIELASTNSRMYINCARRLVQMAVEEVGLARPELVVWSGMLVRKIKQEHTTNRLSLEPLAHLANALAHSEHSRLASWATSAFMEDEFDIKKAEEICDGFFVNEYESVTIIDPFALANHSSDSFAAIFYDSKLNVWFKTIIACLGYNRIDDALRAAAAAFDAHSATIRTPTLYRAKFLFVVLRYILELDNAFCDWIIHAFRFIAGGRNERMYYAFAILVAWKNIRISPHRHWIFSQQIHSSQLSAFYDREKYINLSIDSDENGTVKNFYDIHTKEGRLLGRGQEHFHTQAAKIYNCPFQFAHEENTWMQLSLAKEQERDFVRTRSGSRKRKSTK